ncbi:acetyl/propionyl/methylcrotonyl-CoA carboxylase subunit alpha [Castellaniella sp.]|uniref:acetyl-CoA carboxylase biotin carboxylase subunit n=1 Tax=Castellaniella sp. TaxID=1955812 RepID=UPI0035632CE1
MARILIANRGEIACRILRSCRTLGHQAIAVYSPADAGSPHVRMADVAYALPANPARKSYASIDTILEAAQATRADAIHPGYGFLAESGDFARQVRQAGLCWIGPDPESIDAMGDKKRARDIARTAGVPVLEGSCLITPDSAPDDILRTGRGIGFPLLIKAVAGGGGMGMQQVTDESDLLVQTSQVQHHALRLYGNPAVYFEKCLTRARHVEVQVFGLGHGKGIHLHARECSIQRRYQKVIEESLGEQLPAHVGERVCAAALRLVHEQNYSGAGTVEFLYDDTQDAFYFLEMNTRIQVEHAITEMVCDMDLVALQIRLALGEDLTEELPAAPSCNGHAIECRLYAEDPQSDFRPSAGTLRALNFPPEGPGLRIDTGVERGSTISPFYDPMIAKIITHGSSREAARLSMLEALSKISIEGVHTNLGLLRDILQSPEVIAGRVHTRFLGEALERLAGVTCG